MNLNSKNKLFVRSYTSADNEIRIKNFFFNKLTKHNVLQWSLAKTKHYYDIRSEVDFLAYRFDILANWIDDNEVYNNEYVNNLNKIIYILDISNFFNALEREYINNLNSLNFEKKRIHKKIIVDFKLKKNEYALFVLENVNLVQISLNNNSKKTIAKNFKVYITNKAIVATDVLYKIRISYEKSLSFKLSKNGVYWYGINLDFEFQTNEKYLLYEYLKNMIFLNLKKHNKHPFTWPNGYLNRVKTLK